MIGRSIPLIVLAVFMLCQPAFSQTQNAPLPEVRGIEAADIPSDAGRGIIVSWPLQAGEGKGLFYRIEAAPSENGPWAKVAYFESSRMWTAHYPEIFGRHATEGETHAFKLSNAPVPKALAAELEKKSKIQLATITKKLDAISHTIAANQAAYRAYVQQRLALEGDIETLEALDTKQAIATRLERTQQLETLTRSKRHFTTLYDQQKAFLKRQARLADWTPPSGQALVPDHPYFVRIRLERDRQTGPWALASATPRGNWINTNRLNNLVIALLLAGLILYYTQRARKNPEQIFVRRIAGLEAVDEAIGRATEMGKPIFFVHGLAAISTISTVAAINILGKIAEKVAEYGTEFKVTNRDPVVLAVSQETVKEAYLRSGRPDLYNEDHVFYVSQDQFSYATGVEGMFMREKPASNFFFGYYYAEALLLTETGAHIGAIQIAGTDSYTQLPFFITTCDYTLMGEELYAASAYMSREPRLLASLKAQDITKGLIILFTVAGVILSTLGIPWLLDLVDPF